jgi:hypothetical protein
MKRSREHTSMLGSLARLAGISFGRGARSAAVKSAVTLALFVAGVGAALGAPGAEDAFSGDDTLAAYAAAAPADAAKDGDAEAREPTANDAAEPLARRGRVYREYRGYGARRRYRHQYA